NNGWVGLRARQDLLDRVLGRKCEAYRGEEDNGQSDDAPRPLLPMRSMAELSPPLFAAVLKELGGPELTQEDYDNYAAAHKDRAAVMEELDGPERGPEYWEAHAAAHGDGIYTPDDPPGPIRHRGIEVLQE
ncbi:unnamed protein product, partial [marine sediment metagenome]